MPVKPSPRVFVSYSHDSPAHKRWVAEFAASLRHNGIDAVLDQWEIGPGDDITLFMEQGLTEADRVLVVCTDNYVRKANAGEGGVGYERMIVTAQIVRDLGTKKFIPVVRNSSGSEPLPTFLGARFFVDLSDGKGDHDAQMEMLLRELHQVPKEPRPPLGPNPFKKLGESPAAQASAEPPTARVLPTIEAAASLSPIEAYDLAIDLARSQDLVGWRQMSKRLSLPLASILSELRRRHEASPPKTIEALFALVDEAIEAIAPLMAVALAGVESDLPKIRDQRSLFDDLVRISGWNPSGLTILVDLPNTLGFVYHSLHGAVSLLTGQLDLAFSLADMEVSDRYRDEPRTLAARRELTGWPESLGGNCAHSWRFISSAPARWPWLAHIFGSDVKYRVALIAYYLSLSCDEFARTVTSPTGRETLATLQFVQFDVPLTFMSEDLALVERATQLVRRNLAFLLKRWAPWGLDEAGISAHWGSWIRASYAWLHNVYPMMSRRLPYANLFPTKK